MSKFNAGDKVIFHASWDSTETYTGTIIEKKRSWYGVYKYQIEYETEGWHDKDEKRAKWIHEQGIVRKNKEFYKELQQLLDILVAKEINICHKEGQPTSRLTSLGCKINDLFKEYN